MTSVFLLRADEEYDDQYELGIFPSLNDAIKARTEYRKQKHECGTPFYDYHRYIVLEFELGKLDEGKLVDVFQPSKSKYRK
ncbi:hypothetical protein FDI40_gp153 [Agrobacterium phage Atu_ph07]|uniref:Uncharacterized protein n=1 Tax=Agrobacterium phage Atu_ph07 TaxID=2024264 RepID=A0A2L0UZI3_9CAUD|nr:hypothetical protein FDI40_gp153 [Agrobacterium phage Atu_ph07]AUZ94935.1 hypothetical protein [Agrobacterium phage Atu_ph07]